MPRLIPTKAPNLLIAPNQYQAIYHEQMNNALRLYFSRIDAESSTLNGPMGAAYLNSPHVAASDSTDQYATANDTPTLVKWNTLESRAGFTLNLDNSATIPISGRYKIDYSLQFTNTDVAQHEVYVWLQVNGGPLANSTSKFTVPARKTPSIFGHLIGYSSVLFNAVGGDKVYLWWATSQAAVSGGADGVFIEHIPAQVVPYVRPANPSAVGSIVFVSCPCEA